MSKPGTAVETPQEAIAATTEPKNGKVVELSREAFLKSALKPVTIEPVDLPFGRVYVRSLPHNVRENYLIDINGVNTGTPNLVNSEPKFACLVLCDKNGERLFTDEDLETVSKFDYDVIDKINQKAGPINGFKVKADEQVERAKNDSAGQPVPAES